MNIDEAIEQLGADHVNAILDTSAAYAESDAYSFRGREADLPRPRGRDGLAYRALADANPAEVRLAATPKEDLEDACREGSETACAELDRRGIEPPLLEVDNADLPMKAEETRCCRPGCDLPAEFEGLCEPCWEIGRDEVHREARFDAALGGGRR